MNLFRLLGAGLLAASLCVPAFAGAREIKVGHGYTNTHPMHLSLLKFAEEVKEKTHGELAFTIVHSGVLGGEVEMTQQLLGGMLESCYIGGIIMLESFVPQAGVEDLPFLFKDSEAVYRAFDGPFGKALAEKYLEPGLKAKAVTYIEHGFRQVTNNKRPIVKPEDLKGLKLRVPPLELRIATFKLFGANPIPIALPELFTALQQNTVDGQENPISMIDSFKFQEVQKYLSLTNHTHTTGVLLIHENIWKQFTPEQQAIILEAGETAKLLSRELTAKSEAETLAKLKQNSSMEINAADYEAFAEKVQPIWQAFTQKNGSDLLDLIER